MIELERADISDVPESDQEQIKLEIGLIDKNIDIFRLIDNNIPQSIWVYIPLLLDWYYCYQLHYPIGGYINPSIKQLYSARDVLVNKEETHRLCYGLSLMKLSPDFELIYDILVHIASRCA